jgi:hypothetical protein
MKKLYFPTQADAQAMADACHAWLINNDVSYGECAGKGMITGWSIPKQEGAQWFIWVNRALSQVDPSIAALFPQGAI